MCLIISILLFFNILLQNPVLVKKIEVKANLVYIDNLDNIYVIDNHVIKKFSAKGLLLSNFSNPFYGRITYVDTKDPLRILVYYQEFNQILFLDSQLSPLCNIIKINDLGIQSASLVCSSAQAGFWIFDNINSQLIRFDRNLQVKFKSIYLDKILPNNQPVFLLEQNDLIYLNSSESGIYIFDNYGNFKKNYSIKIKNEFKVTDNTICYFNNNQLIENDFVTNNIKSINFSVGENFENAVKGTNICVAKSTNYIYIFKL